MAVVEQEQEQEPAEGDLGFRCPASVDGCGGEENDDQGSVDFGEVDIDDDDNPFHTPTEINNLVTGPRMPEPIKQASDPVNSSDQFIPLSSLQTINNEWVLLFGKDIHIFTHHSHSITQTHTHTHSRE